MRLSAPLWTIAGTVAGTAAAVVAYQATAATAPATKPASVTTPEPVPASATSWLPCERGWKVEGNTCVRVKEKVVVVHDLPAPAAAPARTAGVRSTSHDSAPSSTHDAAENENETEHVEHGDESQVEQGDDASQDAEHASDGDGPDHEDVGDDD